jgi:hypothetical protein
MKRRRYAGRPPLKRPHRPVRTNYLNGRPHRGAGNDDCGGRILRKTGAPRRVGGAGAVAKAQPKPGRSLSQVAGRSSGSDSCAREPSHVVSPLDPDGRRRSLVRGPEPARGTATDRHQAVIHTMRNAAGPGAGARRDDRAGRSPRPGRLSVPGRGLRAGGRRRYRRRPRTFGRAEADRATPVLRVLATAANVVL